MSETIIAAACIYKGVTYSVPPPGRHHDVIKHIISKCRLTHNDFPICGPDEQGFLTSTGRFVNRTEARQLAEAANQILEKRDADGIPFSIKHSHLFSEDIW